jgi:phospholipase C
MLNHFWLIGARTPTWLDAPEELRANPTFDAEGRLVDLVRDGAVTPDGFVVNTVQPSAHPFLKSEPQMPPQDYPTIGDLLSDAGKDWTWYAGGWNEALEHGGTGNTADELRFHYHHQPFVYFARFADSAVDERKMHLKDEEAFRDDCANGALPAVSFVKPSARFDEHAGIATVAASEQHAAELIETVMASPAWDRAAIIVTYDDFGGWYDHVPPPPGDQWGPGGRVPALIISPYAKRGFIDSTFYDTTSILKFIEWRFGLASLTDRDKNANNLLNAFDFGSTPASSPVAS